MNSTPIDLLLDLRARSIEGQKIANNLRTRSIKWRTSRSTIDQKARATNRRDRSMAPRGGVDEFGTNLLITRLLDRWARSIEGQKTAKRLADETNRTVYESIYNRSKGRCNKQKRQIDGVPCGVDDLDTYQSITQLRTRSIEGQQITKRLVDEIDLTAHGSIFDRPKGQSN